MTVQGHTSAHSQTSGDAWTKALTNFIDADARFEPVCAALSQAERAYFALTKKDAHEANRDLLAERRAKKRLDKAYEADRRCGAAVHEAVQALLRVPAPNLSALVSKVEIITRHECDEDCVQSILSDLRSLAARN
ncbi:hypothetical protein [Novosphingobium sp. 9U]|uniref:hypothetical protein n=1 Tax=Novosphingobium sp. 9U TaxID=2653158 RepID=UPI0012F349AE|nr:hypothetical protein [Novosphingobium sp. 9U]VWX49748.1 hypothetical protein NOVOSPHI9U_260021 [Novosphingobium sp. 9U]